MKERSKKALASVTPEGKAAMQRVRDRMKAKLAMKAKQMPNPKQMPKPEPMEPNPIEAHEL